MFSFERKEAECISTPPLAFSVSQFRLIHGLEHMLQRIEQFSGVTILATNSARNFGEAFRRRMSYFINVPMPDEATRLRIWQKVFHPELLISRQVKFEELAREFELSGSSIKSVAVSAAYAAAAAGTEVTRSSMYEALRIEYGKTGHLFTEAMYHR